jgi:hypothetical protein
LKKVILTPPSTSDQSWDLYDTVVKMSMNCNFYTLYISEFLFTSYSYHTLAGRNLTTYYSIGGDYTARPRRHGKFLKPPNEV